MHVLKLARMISFWTGFRKRVHDQLIVELDETRNVILPRVIVAGTITRRAVEKTWLTAANPKRERSVNQTIGLV